MYTRGLMILALSLAAASVAALEVPTSAAPDFPVGVRDTVYVGSEEPEVILPPPPSAQTPVVPVPEPAAGTVEPALPRPCNPCPAEMIRDGRMPCAGECGPPRPCCDYWLSPCNLVQHLPYPPACHGWYYFRPYNAAQLPQIQQVVISWGGDPRNPCSNEIFQSVYHGTKDGGGSPTKDVKRIAIHDLNESEQNPRRAVVLRSLDDAVAADQKPQRGVVLRSVDDAVTSDQNPRRGVVLRSVDDASGSGQNPQRQVVLRSIDDALAADRDPRRGVVLRTAGDASGSDENPQRKVLLRSVDETSASGEKPDETSSDESPLRGVILKWLDRLQQQVPDSSSQIEIRDDSAAAAP